MKVRDGAGKLLRLVPEWSMAAPVVLSPPRPGQPRPERLETEVVDIASLTTDDQYGTPEHGRHANRRDLAAKLSHAVVVRPWHHWDDGPGGNPRVPDPRYRPEAAAPL
jgi:hypothetical protein